MATLTLDEIEALARAHAATATLPGGYVQMDVERVSDALLGLVAHVRALENVTRMTDDKALERITAMEAKVSALSAADDVGRAAARAESATSPRMAQKAWAPVAEELDRLRAENAELRAEIARMESRHNEQLAEGRAVNARLTEERDRQRAENERLKNRVAAMEEWQSPKHDWPAPQPIETAPLGRTVFWYSIAFKEWRCFAVTAEDMDEVRAGYSHWIPMPPPPGGGK